MEKQIITFSANEQCLQKTGGVDCYASNTVAYIEAHFDLGTNWSGYDSVRAVWFTDFVGGISTVLDSDGTCIVPYEVLTRKSAVKVNLVGSIAENDVLTDRLTTCPVVALTIKCNAKVTGDETVPITPSQFEQFVATVIAEVEKVTGMTAVAETLPSGSQATASYSNGVLQLGIPQGAQGEQGESGVGIASVTLNADYTLTITMTDGTSITTTSIRGERGEKGETGADGITPSISIGNVETLEPNEDAYVTRRGTDAEPIFDFGIPKGDKGEDAVIPWDSILPVDTASGSIASFPDGTDLVPAKSLKVALEPIQEGSGEPSPTNIRPISGRTEVVTQRTGVNVWDEEWELGGFNWSTGAKTSSNSQIRTKNYISVLPSTTYCIALPQLGSTYLRRIYYDANFNYISAGSFVNGTTVQFTTPSNCHYIMFGCASLYGTTYNNDISINYPSTDTDYHAYEGETYTTDLGRTVYGGVLDVVSGELVVDMAMVDLGTLDYTKSSTINRFITPIPQAKRFANLYTRPDIANLVCSIYETVGGEAGYSGTNDYGISGSYWNGTNYLQVNDLEKYSNMDASAFKTAMNGVQLCYELANPQTIQLTPQEVQLLLGNNNVWSDGDVTLVYNADIQRWVEKKLNV